jgi:quercetin dioxygenase-like cupin family protein
LSEINMKATRIIAVSMLAIASSLALQLASAQQPGVKRTELQRHDLSVPGREVVQVRVEVDPGVALPMHTHPGEEIVYVLEGTFEFQIEGKSTTTLKAGDVSFVPAGVKHAPKNVGSSKGTVLATYVVEKGKPLVVPAK